MYDKEYYEKNKEKIRERSKIYRERYKSKTKLWFESHKDELKKKQKIYYLKNRDKINEKGRLRHEKNKDKNKKKRHQYYENNKDKIKKTVKDWYETHKEEAKKKAVVRGVKYRMEMKVLVLSHYSGGVPRCVCCGEKEVDFLTINHKNKDGKKHREEVGSGGGASFYRWLIKNGFPDNLGLEVLCHNCNCGSWYHDGVCPHKLRKLEGVE